jgi:hypothetical protein
MSPFKLLKILLSFYFFWQTDVYIHFLQAISSMPQFMLQLLYSFSFSTSNIIYANHNLLQTQNKTYSSMPTKTKNIHPCQPQPPANPIQNLLHNHNFLQTPTKTSCKLLSAFNAKLPVLN